MKNLIQKVIFDLNKEFNNNSFIIIDNNMDLNILLKLINNFQTQKEVTLFCLNNRDTSSKFNSSITSLLAVPRNIFYITISPPSIIIGPYLRRQHILSFSTDIIPINNLVEVSLALTEALDNTELNLILILKNIIYLLLISHFNKNDLFIIDTSSSILKINRTETPLSKNKRFLGL